MSRKSEDSTPIRIDLQMHEWIMTLKEAYNMPNVSDTLRLVLKKAHPNIEEIVRVNRQKEEERNALLSELIARDVDGVKE